ncbi:uncharacterized protein [Oscarella lobularis]|uniref:uncharacterized protein n=1 Tax=Oscarella lobularis TaxID=121494 RepID=UPI0033137E65
MSASFPVKLHVYDLSRGLARQLSEPLLGKRLDGVWHTGVLVFGKEYFFGSLGIEWCPPGGTILGTPDQVIDMGNSHVPEEIFNEYLISLKDDFSPSSYHLLEHNCNNFSAEIVQFLTGNPIPQHITNLPQEVMSTPFGAMLKPILDSMSMRSASPASSSQLQGRVQPSSTRRLDASSSPSPSSTKTNKKMFYWPLNQALKKCEALLEDSWVASSEYAAADEARQTISQLLSHLKTESTPFPTSVLSLIGNLLSYKSEEKKKEPLLNGLELLSLVVLSEKGRSHYVQKSDHLIFRLLRSYAKRGDQDIDLALIHLLCNLCSRDDGAYLADSSRWKIASSKSTNNVDEAVSFVVERLTSKESATCWPDAARLFHNLALVKMSYDNELAIASASLECIKHQVPTDVARWLFPGLLAVAQRNAQACELAVMLYDRSETYSQESFWEERNDYLTYLEFERIIKT